MRKAALEVYVRRAYISYDLTCLQHHEMLNGLCVVQFQFLLPSSHPNRIPHNKACGLTGAENTVVELPLPLDLENCQRTGAMAAFTRFEDFANCFELLMELFDDSPPPTPRVSESESNSPNDHLNSTGYSDEENQKCMEPIHILNVAVKIDDDCDDNAVSAMYARFCTEKRNILQNKCIRRVTFVTLYRHQFPKYFTYRARDHFEEDRIYRHLEPALAFQLEINRMKNYDLEALTTSNQKIYLYLGKAKVAKGQEVTDYRFFVRSIVRHSDLITKEASFEFLQNEGERLLLESMDELEVAFSHPNSRRTDCNHIFLNFVPNVIMDPSKLEESVRGMVIRYGPRLWKLRVLQAELKMTIRLIPNGKPIPIRLVLANESGYYLDICLYKEVTDPKTGIIKFEAWGTKQGPLHGLPISSPYVTKDYLQQKRFQAQSNGTTYVYDFPDMFKQALLKHWGEYKTNRTHVTVPSQVLSFVELVLDSEGQLIEYKRLPGENKIGMVAWRMTLHTPEYVGGRDIIVISNDITHQIGSFSPKEDYLFLRASEMARQLHIPRVYLAANSGARIGLAEEIKHLFDIAWEDPSEPDMGFKYLYLSPENYKKVSALNSVRTELIEDDGEPRYKITDIVGKEDGLGVENLRCSGMIAGETSQAYDEIATISMVTCRAIGIGAYLVRLGQRIIQVENSHIILTGAGALNKLLGREVYSSNNQLGGIQIMHANGVSHITASDDLEGVYQILKWLSYIPKAKGLELPLIDSLDPVDRDVQYTPARAPYDPRWLLAGRPSPSNPDLWESGFFDRDSFIEMMRPWAQTVVVGRARLGGIPLGVIAVETRTVEVAIPADPANLDSEAKLISQAGQVWFPDSAYKTSQAIKDFNREGLPLMIFANWRGFSGGMKDMYDQIIKFGAYIVDGLREYKQPILVYIPPYAELRGGAWVVVDPTINLQHMEMYADPESRGGVLEPEGTVEIKFRARDLLKTMHRVDPECVRLRESLNNSDISTEQKSDLDQQLHKREQMLLPIYHQVALYFADLHDTAARMQEKGVIQDIIPWRQSRRVLFWRLRRLLLQDQVTNRIMKVKPDLNHGQVESMLRRWFVEEKGEVASYLWDDNRAMVDWLMEQLDENKQHSIVSDNIRCICRDAMINNVKSLLQEHPEVAMDTIMHIAQHVPPLQCAELLRTLSALETNE